MATATAECDFLTTGQAAMRFGAPAWTLTALFRRGLFPEPHRLAQTRIIREDDLPKLRAALVAAGYLHRTGEGNP